MRPDESMVELARLVLAEMEAEKSSLSEIDTPSPAMTLILWLIDRCVYRDRTWTAIWALHRDFTSWRAERWQPIPTSQKSFEAALVEEGFYVEDGFCYGLIPSDHLNGL